ncbi:AAA family ATPase [Lichenihabitans sp. PAMC28606]|uniref:ATPase domain-containing protein n=1 Tax=Lichenihabitans sp. PAMC28606 TaxID=2880932 RepID=UPI001D0B44ED|nr:ATPase domain-containing protein [Lichenihabitans sp. PAMC28606]UDL93873.1 AAA family ATPase [Lichenihabitans sp. PAMC28606]
MIAKSKARVSTGVSGLDNILGGGLTPDRLYLVEGTPGTGKTTLALQFLMEGIRQGESGLYITLSETEEELRAGAATHGWTLDGVTVSELVTEDGLDPNQEQSILHSSEIELGETTGRLIDLVTTLEPRRIVFDSLSEFRLLAQNPLRYRRQILALKQFFANRKCIVILLDDRTLEPTDLQLHSIAHGVIRLEQHAQEYGSERRRLQIIKMRGTKFRGGFHDLNIETGGIVVFPRLIASEHHADFVAAPLGTGSSQLDALLGGGLLPGTNALFSGPSGVGKTSTAVSCMMAAIRSGKQGVYYLFDEGRATLLERAAHLGMDLGTAIEAGKVDLRQIDPAELSPGEFANHVRRAVEEDGANFVVIDSLNAYLHAMPGQKFLLLQMHELLTYLNQLGVVTILILGQHGIVGDVRSDVDLSYLSDTIMLFRFFEAQGEVRKAVAVVKSRAAKHERTIREFRLTSTGLEVGKALRDFEGVLSGLPSYRGEQPMLGQEPSVEA